MLSVLACKRSKVIVPIAIFAYWPGCILWKVPLHCCVGYRTIDAVRVYRQGFSWLRVTMGSDEVLGCHSDHQSH